MNLPGIIKKYWYVWFRHTRKNFHLTFFIRQYLKFACPSALLRRQLPTILDKFRVLPEDDQKYILERVNYYCKFAESDKIESAEPIELPVDAPHLWDFKYRQRENYVHDYVNSTYFFDIIEYLRYFPLHYRWAYNPGDVNYLFPVPEITKSRPILDGTNKNRNNILMNLDKVRHFTWVKDPYSWEEKECRIIFRGDTTNKPHRIRFIEMWRNHPWCDLRSGGNMDLYDHLKYRYIMALEGNDVASNLKWVMSSNSIAVMPRPKFETWYMEAKLIPNHHYIEIASDYHDLIERIEYFESHPDEAKRIIKNAHIWVEQFQNKKREKLISLMVLQKYFRLTGQTSDSQGPRRFFVNDVVKLNTSQKHNAQGKARGDVKRTLTGLGYKIWDIVNPKYSFGKSRRYHHYPIYSKWVQNRQVRTFVRQLRQGDSVFIQDFDLAYMRMITDECRKRNIEVTYLVHDVQCIRFNIVTPEIEQLNKASLLLVHTEAMRQKLHELGVTVPMKTIQLFDYYSSDPMNGVGEILECKNQIVFAGNLMKSVFLEQLCRESFGKIRFNLYGFKGETDFDSFPHTNYCGFFEPDSTDSIKGGWGLVWDGDSIDTCCGIMGDYLRYNSSHKISLYLACGIPLIVWNHSSIASWVREKNIGITVDSLHNLGDTIGRLSDEEYALMIENAQKVGQQLRQGSFLKSVLVED